HLPCLLLEKMPRLTAASVAVAVRLGHRHEQPGRLVGCGAVLHQVAHRIQLERVAWAEYPEVFSAACPLTGGIPIINIFRLGGMPLHRRLHATARQLQNGVEQSLKASRAFARAGRAQNADASIKGTGERLDNRRRPTPAAWYQARAAFSCEAT